MCVSVSQPVTSVFLRFAPYFSQTGPKTFDYKQADRCLTFDLQPPGAASALRPFREAPGAPPACGCEDGGSSWGRHFLSLAWREASGSGLCLRLQKPMRFQFSISLRSRRGEKANIRDFPCLQQNKFNLCVSTWKDKQNKRSQPAPSRALGAPRRRPVELFVSHWVAAFQK